LATFSQPRFDERPAPKLLFIGGDFERKGGWDVLDVFTEHFAETAELHIMTNKPIKLPDKNIHLHFGVLPYSPEWHQILRDADILVVPSYAEPYGLVFQEAGGYGLALVGSRVGGIPEIVVEGETGVLIEPGDRQQLQATLEHLLSDRQRLAAMRKRSWEVAFERSWSASEALPPPHSRYRLQNALSSHGPAAATARKAPRRAGPFRRPANRSIRHRASETRTS
jgi:glycosyltransferase involved in cell wall biosynthesis